MAYASPSITTSGIAFSALKTDGLSGLIEALITANSAAISNPTTGPTLSESGSSGTLTAATYYAVQTETNGTGETLPSTVSAGQAITGTEELVITKQALQTGSTAWNAYVGTSSTGPFYLVASGQTGSSVTIASLPTNSYAVTPPTVNSTGLTSDGTPYKIQAIRACKNGNLQDVYRGVRQLVDNFNSPQNPVAFQAAIQKLRNYHTAIAMLNEALTEVGTLLDANPGTIRNTVTPIGTSTLTRTEP